MRMRFKRILSDDEKEKYTNLSRAVYDTENVFNKVFEVIHQNDSQSDKKIADSIVNEIDSIIEIFKENSDIKKIKKTHEQYRSLITWIRNDREIGSAFFQRVFIKKCRVLKYLLGIILLTMEKPEHNYLIISTDEEITKIEIMPASIDGLINDMIENLTQLKELVGSEEDDREESCEGESQRLGEDDRGLSGREDAA